MARNGVQYSDVQQAIDQLLARGDTPSVQRIREVLGTGSFTTISEHFRIWRTEREQNRDIPPPKGVPDVIVKVAGELWREAQEAANHALSHYREDANRQVEAAQRDTEEAVQQAANAEQRESALAEHLRHIEQRLETLGGELAASQNQELHWQQLAKKAAQETQDYQQRYAQAKQRIEALQAQHATEQKQYTRQWENRLTQEEKRNEAAEGKLMTLLDALRQERTQEEKSSQKRIQQWEKRTEALNKELQHNKEALQQYQVDNSAHRQQIAELERINAELKEQQSQLQRQLSEACNALEQQHKQVEQDAQWQRQLWQRMETLQAQMTALPDALNANEALRKEARKPSR